MEARKLEIASLKRYEEKLPFHSDSILRLFPLEDSDGSLMISACSDETLAFWDMEKREVVKTLEFKRPNQEQLEEFKGRVKELERYIYDTDQEARSEEDLLRIEMNKLVSVYELIEGKLITGYYDGLICAWDLSSAQIISPLTGHERKVNQVLHHQEKLFSISNDQSIRVWNKQSLKCFEVLRLDYPVLCGQIEPESNSLFIGCFDHVVRQLDLDSYKVLRKFKVLQSPVRCLLATPDFLYVSGYENNIRRINLETEEKAEFFGHSSKPYSLALYDEFLFSTGDDHSIIVWDQRRDQVADQLQGHTNCVTSIAFVNGKMFSGGFDHDLFSWNLEEILECIEEGRQMRENHVESVKIENY
mmetsp:Transcript_6555/g.11090  ORF Transcript_6555/g.11090 Transcript_6555/m.11090 type:complete len:359 (+) Transcript_6555:45-1121(+)